VIEPAKRATVRDVLDCRPLGGLVMFFIFIAILGLAPQALFFRPLRGLAASWLIKVESPPQLAHTASGAESLLSSNFRLPV
jgi:hypothetical protein